MNTRMRIAVAGIAILGLVVVLVVRDRTGGIEVQTAQVTQGDFEVMLAEDGRTRARWHVDITAPVTGVWVPVGLVVGDTVSAGQVLGTLRSVPQDPATAGQVRARVGVATAGLDAALAAEAAATIAAREAQRDRERMERLVVGGGVSDQALERVRAADEGRRRELDAARAHVAAARYELEAARAFLPGGSPTPVRILSPGAGVVLRVDEEHERVVPAGAPLLQVGAIGDQEIVARVLSTDAPRVPVGASMLVLIGRDTLRGHVTRVEPTAQTVRSALGVEEQRVAVVGDVHGAGVRLGHDFQVDVRIVTDRFTDVLVIPAGALLRDGAGWAVFALTDEGTVRRQAVTVLGMGAEQAAVEGLAVGTLVVVYPPEGLEDGGRVRR